MMIGLGLGLTAARGADTTAPDMLTIGALTAVGAGARSISVADGTYGPYTVSGGVMTPNTSPVGPGSYDVGGTMITAEADTYDVASAAEYATVLALGGATLSGKTIKGLPGVDLAGTSPGNSVSYPGTLTLASPLTVTSRNPASPCYHRRMVLAHDGMLTLRQVVIRDTFLLADTYGATNIIRFASPGYGRSGLTLDRCEAWGGDVTTLDLSVLVSGTGAATAAGTTITLTGSPDLSGVATDRSMMIWAGGVARVITGVDNSAKTVTVSSAITVSSADYKIIYTPQILRIIGQNTGLGNWPDLVVTNCELHDFDRAITGQYRIFECTENDFDKAYSDYISMSVDGTETKLEVIRNVMRRPCGQWDDPLTPHVDGIQINTGPMVQDNTTPYRIIGNVFFCGPDGRGREIQGCFIENIPASRRVLMDIQHNVSIAKARNAVTIERPAAGTIIAGNTAVFDATTEPPTGLTPAIATVSGAYPTDDLATVRVEYNVAPAVTVSAATVVGNHLFGAGTSDNEAADYAAVFAGVAADFNSDNLTTAAQVRAALTPDTTTLWPTGRVRRGAMSGYYDYTTGAADEPWLEAGWSASVAWGDITGAAVSGAVQSSKLQVTGVSATGTAVVVSGGTSPTLTLFDTDGTTVIVSGVPDVLATAGQWVQVSDTASGTGLTELTVTIHAGTTTGTWTFETEDAAYAVNWVEFDGTNDWIATESGFSTATSKLALAVFGVYVPTTWPSSGTILSMATAGGNAQLTVAFLSSNRMSLTARNTSNTIIGTWISSVSQFSADTEYLMAVALDTNTGKGWQVYRSTDGGASWSTVSAGTNTFTVDEQMAACTRCRFGAANSSGSTRVPLSYYADVWADIGQTLDLSVSGNRDLFALDADKGSDGSTPTGSAPALFLSGSTASWATNKGDGGSLTLFGALADAPSPPN